MKRSPILMMEGLPSKMDIGFNPSFLPLKGPQEPIDSYEEEIGLSLDEIEIDAPFSPATSDKEIVSPRTDVPMKAPSISNLQAALLQQNQRRAPKRKFSEIG